MALLHLDILQTKSVTIFAQCKSSMALKRLSGTCYYMNIYLNVISLGVLVPCHVSDVYEFVSSPTKETLPFYTSIKTTV